MRKIRPPNWLFIDRPLLVAQPKEGWPQVLPDDILQDIRLKSQFYRAFSGHHAFGIHELFGRSARV